MTNHKVYLLTGIFTDDEAKKQIFISSIYQSVAIFPNECDTQGCAKTK